MAEVGSKDNVARIFNCTGDRGPCNRLVQELTGQKNDNDSTVQWSIDNKYYSTVVDIRVHHVTSDAVGECDGEAIVFLCSVETITKCQESWSKLSSGCDGDSLPSVRLLVVLGSGDCSQEDLEWCIENEFELIEWPQNHDIKNGGGGDVDDERDVGIGRISDALQSHMWPSMSSKQAKVTNSSSKGASVAKTQDTQQKPVDINSLSVEQLLARGLNDDDGDDGEEESFEELFGKFSEMKAHAESLPHQERKEYAEKVAVAFWKAMGGADDEII